MKIERNWRQKNFLHRRVPPLNFSKNLRLNFEIVPNGQWLAGPYSRCPNIIKLGPKLNFDAILDGSRPPQFLARLQPKLCNVWGGGAIAPLPTQFQHLCYQFVSKVQSHFHIQLMHRFRPMNS